MYGARQRSSHLICGQRPSITDTSIALEFAHLLEIVTTTRKDPGLAGECVVDDGPDDEEHDP
jgi:hypothetical protein